MSLKVKGIDVVDDDRNIVNVLNYNGYVPANQSRTITGGDGLTGGGNLSSNRTLSIDPVWVANNLTISAKSPISSNLDVDSWTGLDANDGSVAWASGESANAPGNMPTGAGFYCSGLQIKRGTRKSSGIVLSGTTNRMWFRGATTAAASTPLPWTEVWSSDNLPNPVRTDISVIAGSGLTGGGNLSANVTLDISTGWGLQIAGGSNNVRVQQGAGITVAADGVHVMPGNAIIANSTGTHVRAGNGIVANSTGVHVNAGNGLSSNSTTVFVNAGNGLATNGSVIHIVPAAGGGILANPSTLAVDGTVARTSSTISGGLGLSGSGNTGSNITLNVNPGNAIIANSTGTHVRAGNGIVANSTGVHVGSTVVLTSRNIVAGDGLSGGGTLAANRTLSVQAGLGLVANSVGTHVQAGNGLIANNSGLHVVGGGGISSTAGNVSVDNTVLRTTGAQTIVGNKTFSSHQMFTSGTWNNPAIRFSANAGIGWSGSVNTLGMIDESGETILQVKPGEIRFYSEVSGSAAYTAIRREAADTGNRNVILPAGNVTLVTGTMVPTSTTISTGNGLTGGGTLAANRTLSVGQGDGINVTTTAVNVRAGNGIVANSTGVHVVSAAVGGGSDSIFYENDQIVTTDYTITSGKNAMSSGPISINNGRTVTIGVDQSWSIV